MRKLLALSCLAVGVALGVFVVLGTGHVARGMPAPPPPAQNGDVNGDGTLDISDAVYLLLFMFREGTPPVDCTGSAELVGRVRGLEAEEDALYNQIFALEEERDGLKSQLATRDRELVECRAQVNVLGPRAFVPATGQKSCFDTGGNSVPCDSPEWIGQDGYYRKGCPREGRYIDNGDGTVTDGCTLLQWQKYVLFDGQEFPDHDGLTTWEDALHLCERLDYWGHDDWRLPNINELASLDRVSSDGSLAPDPGGRQIPELNWGDHTYNGAGQEIPPANIFWSSTSIQGGSFIYVWHSNSGAWIDSSRIVRHYVRAVRGPIQ